jgi:NAD(P)-dependent dehydrogenase (short-subunit alcohol dehydrogenase family)
MSQRTWTSDRMPSQAGRTVVITGGAGGIGLRAAQAFARHGAKVIIGARSAAKAERAVAQIGTNAEWLPLDLADLAAVEGFADRLMERGATIDVLVNCAGVMAIPRRELTVDGFEKHFGTNHLGHFALTGRLLPLLDGARVITVSAQSARSARIRPDDLQLEHGYAPMRAYGNSKLANILFAVELNRHAPLLSIPVHPGTAPTDIQQYGSSRIANALGRVIMRAVGQPLDHVADPITFAATTPDATGQSFIAPTGPFQLGGTPGFVKLPPAALDAGLRATLWRESESLTKVTY